MFVSVSYYDERVSGFKAGASYTYETHRTDLTVGTVVAAPVRNRGTGTVEDKKAIVVETDLPKPSFPCSVITQTWAEAEE